MPRLQSKLAKLTAPRLHKAVARERLYQLLDLRRAQPVTWISGPPGSGKTTLVASYLDKTGSPAMWYHVDKGDSDPATLFYYLAEGIADVSGRNAKRLPLLTPEYLPDLDGFARRFFRNAFVRLPSGTVFVFDNYQDVAEDSAVHRILNAAFEQVPETGNVIIISRSPPPATFARQQLVNSLVTLGWEDLRLDAAETAAIAATRVRDLSAEMIQTIHVQADGWVAGVRLLLDRVDSSGKRLDSPHALDGTFDYFASEIFDATPVELQQLLLKTAFFPRFTVPIAIAATGNDQAGRILEELYRRRLFIDRRLGIELTYQYHDLFRAFLCSRVESQFSTEQVASIARDSAKLLLAGNLVDEAFALFVRAQDWEQAEQLFIAQAQTLIAQGRWRTLEQWGSALPSARIERSPWVRYWLGRSKTLVDPGSARLVLEGACASFSERKDALGELLSAAAVVDALHFEVTAFQLIGPWLNRLALLADAYSDDLPIDPKLSVHATLMTASSHLALPGPTLHGAVEKVKELLPDCSAANLTLSVANMVQYYSGHCLDSDAQRMATREARRMLDRADLSADRLALYLLSEGHAQYMFGRYKEALDCFDAADTVIEEHGLVGRMLVAGTWRCQTEAAFGNIRAAQGTVARVEKRILDDHSFVSALFRWAQGTVAFAAGERERSIELGLAAIAQNREYGSPVTHALWFPRMCYRLIASGLVERASEMIIAQPVQPEALAYTRLQSASTLMRAWIAFRKGDAVRCEQLVRDALKSAHDERERTRLRWFPLALAELLPIALENGIERGIARTLITECNLKPAHTFLESWPWPVRIYTLGRFEMLVDDKPIEFKRKAPKRTLALLKAIVAFGGKDVTEQRLADALWPEHEGDAAHESLAAALHRLRRLLGGNQYIVQSEGMLSLDSDHCFVDTWAFDMSLQQPERVEAALRIYRGGFLEGEADTPWSVSLRERLRSKFVRAVQSSAQRLETEGRHTAAIDLYLRGLEADDLVEAFYQGLMRSYHSAGRNAEATAIFRRLSRTLAASLGLEPSLDSQRLFKTVSGVGPPP